MLGVHVISANVADWTFDQTVTVAGSPANMKVNASTPNTSGTNQAANVIRVGYGAVISNGQPWAINAAVSQVTPTPAFPQSGTTA